MQNPMQRYLIATATGILVLTLGGCAVTPIDNHSNGYHRHDGWDKKGWNNDHNDDRRNSDRNWNRNRDGDRSRWDRRHDHDDDYDNHDDWRNDRR